MKDFFEKAWQSVKDEKGGGFIIKGKENENKSQLPVVNSESIPPKAEQPQPKVYEKEHAELVLSSEAESILSHLGLTPENLENKRVADIGAGDRYLAAYCLKNEITSEVYSVEPKLGRYDERKFLETNFPQLEEKVREKTVSARMEALPFENESMDMVVYCGSFLPYARYNHAYPDLITATNEGMVDNINKTFNESIRILKKEGIARIWPLREEWKDDKNKEVNDFWRKSILEKCTELESAGLCQVSFERANAQSAGKIIPTSRILITKL